MPSNHVQFQEDYFEQTDGAIMGSLLSPVIANLFMEDLEQKAIQSAVLQPKLWVRYVDDTFIIWPHGKEHLHVFHEELNQQNPNIQFIIEGERGSASLSGRLGYPTNRQDVYLSVPEANKH